MIAVIVPHTGASPCPSLLPLLSCITLWLCSGLSFNCQVDSCGRVATRQKRGPGHKSICQLPCQCKASGSCEGLDSSLDYHLIKSFHFLFPPFLCCGFERHFFRDHTHMMKSLLQMDIADFQRDIKHSHNANNNK